MIKRLSLTIAAVVLLFGLVSVFAQSPVQSTVQSTVPSTVLTGEPLLRALLEEMRAIRTMMQTSSAQELRGRLLIERIKMQQEVVRDLARDIEQSTPAMPPVTEIDPYSDMEEDIDRRVRAETEPERKRIVEREKERLKRRRDMETYHREQSRLRIQRMENRLVEEREKLRILEDELTRLLREMSGNPAR